MNDWRPKLTLHFCKILKFQNTSRIFFILLLPNSHRQLWYSTLIDAWATHNLLIYLDQTLGGGKLLLTIKGFNSTVNSGKAGE